MPGLAPGRLPGLSAGEQRFRLFAAAALQRVELAFRGCWIAA